PQLHMLFSFHPSRAHPLLHPFPTRRSSDLPRESECLPSVEHGELAPKMPVLSGPGKMICPTYLGLQLRSWRPPFLEQINTCPVRSEEHTSELQSRGHLVCRLLLEKKKNIKQ